MSPDLEALPAAKATRERRGIALVWVIPLVALAIGVWLVVENLVERGPAVSILLDRAEGIEPGKTRIRFRDVTVGKVETVQFTRDLKRVRVGARLDKAFAGRLTTSTRFWVVRPRLEGARVSGLDTLLGGAYIAMDLGATGGDARHEFRALDEPPGILSDTPGALYTLDAERLGSLDVGSPVYFRGIQVGEVTAYRLRGDASAVEIDVFIHAPHARAVKRASHFWDVSGVAVTLDDRGIDLRLASVSALLSGGVAFDSPADAPTAEAGRHFHLFPDHAKSQEQPIRVGQPYVLYFQGSLRGLEPGAAVEYQGIRVGTVREVGFESSFDKRRVRAVTVIEIEPERVAPKNREMPREEQLRRTRIVMEELVRKGLRAQLKTGNLLTGKLFVDLAFFPEAPAAEVVHEGGRLILPTVPATLENLSRGLTRFIARIDHLPLESMGTHLEGALAGADRLVNAPELRGSIQGLEVLVRRGERLLHDLDPELVTLARTLTRTGRDAHALITGMRETVDQFTAAGVEVNRLLKGKGPVGRVVRRMLGELAATAHSLKLMLDYLERHPEALIKGKTRY